MKGVVAAGVVLVAGVVAYGALNPPKDKLTTATPMVTADATPEASPSPTPAETPTPTPTATAAPEAGHTATKESLVPPLPSYSLELGPLVVNKHPDGSVDFVAAQIRVVRSGGYTGSPTITRYFPNGGYCYEGLKPAAPDLYDWTCTFLYNPVGRSFPVNFNATDGSIQKSVTLNVSY